MNLEIKPKRGKKNIIIESNIEELIEEKKEPEPEPEQKQIFTEKEREEFNEYNNQVPQIIEELKQELFLSEMNNENYKINYGSDNDSLPSLIPIKKGRAKKTKAPPKVKLITEEQEPEETGLFSDKPTELLGRERLEIISKINQYKSLFPDQLKKFKVKNKATKEELEAYLSEAEAIVETSNVESFLTDSILECFRLIEGVSARTRYNVSGMTDMLKANKQFHSLCKQLYAKYGCFKKIPPEYQLVMIVSTTAYIAQQRNTHKSSINAFLDEPMTG